MYKITLYTSEWEFSFRTDVPTLPADEFIEAKDSRWQRFYVCRNAVLLYRVIEHKNKPFNS